MMMMMTTTTVATTTTTATATTMTHIDVHDTFTIMKSATTMIWIVNSRVFPISHSATYNQNQLLRGLYASRIHLDHSILQNGLRSHGGILAQVTAIRNNLCRQKIQGQSWCVCSHLLSCYAQLSDLAMKLWPSDIPLSETTREAAFWRSLPIPSIACGLDC